MADKIDRLTGDSATSLFFARVSQIDRKQQMRRAGSHAVDQDSGE